MRCWRSSWAELWQNPAGPDLATTAGWEAMLTAPTRVPLTVDTGTGLLSGVRQVLSANFDARPAGAVPELLVVHGISLPPGEFGGPWIDRLFTGTLPADVHPYFKEIEGLVASTHALIRRDGQIVQYVPFGERAWHAGKSEYQGRSGCNDFSIGIELEGADGTPYTEPQYGALVALVATLLAAYPSLSSAAIAGHSDIAPGRKSDPWATFDWPRFRALLKSQAQQ